LLSREDYPNGVNLTSEQQKFAAQFSRQGSSKIRLGKTKRKLLSVALMPLTTPLRGKQGRRIKSTDLNKRPFVPGNEVAVVTLADHPARHPNQFHFIESRVLVNVGFFDEGGAICVGGLDTQCALRADFSKGPLMKGQRAVRYEHVGPLDAPFTGRLRVVGCGKHVDICVGKHKVGVHGNTMHPTVVYRIDRKFFEGDKPKAELAYVLAELPESGQEVEVDDVQAGSTLVVLHEKCEYFGAQFVANTSEPLMDWPPGRILPASKVDLFRVLLAMNDFQNDVTLCVEEEKPPSVDPSDWAFRAFVAFERRVFKKEDHEDLLENVDVDPLKLTQLPGWTINQALKDDFRYAVGPNGDFQLVADQAGTVTSIAEVPGAPHLTRIGLEGGAYILVPATAVLYIPVEGGVKELAVGDSITEGQPIGDVCQRMRYESWEALAEVLRDNLNWMVDEFLYTTSICHGDEGWDGPEVLYDSRYVTSVLSFSAVTEHNETKWYWDIRKATQFYDKDLNAIVLPPIRYDNWKQLEVSVNGILFDLDDPFSPSVPVAAEAQDSRVTAKAS
jgi:hypothetical protein